MATDTVWVLGDQLDERLAHLADRDPSATTVLMVVSRSKLESRRWGRQRAHFYIASMRRFAERLRSLGFTVDWRVADSMRAGMEDHIAEYGPRAIVAMEPANRAGFHLLERLGVRLIPSDQFLCHRDEFRRWAEEHRRRDGSLLMEDFYRWQRRRLDILIEEDGSPVGGRWNLDEENRLPPPPTEDSGRRRPSISPTTSTTKSTSSSRASTSPEGRGTGRGPPIARVPSGASPTSSRRPSPVSAPTRTRWSATTDISTIRC